MPFINLNRINKGGEILLNSDHIIYVEIEGRSTTVHLHNLLFSVEETPTNITERIEQMETARIKNALVESGVGKANG